MARQIQELQEIGRQIRGMQEQQEEHEQRLKAFRQGMQQRQEQHEQWMKSIRGGTQEQDELWLKSQREAVEDAWRTNDFHQIQAKETLARQVQEQQQANQRQIQEEQTVARRQIQEQEMDGFRQIREQQVRQELHAKVEEEKREWRAELEMLYRRLDAEAAARKEDKFYSFFSVLWMCLMCDAKGRKVRSISDEAGRSSRGGEGSSQNESARVTRPGGATSLKPVAPGIGNEALAVNSKSVNPCRVYVTGLSTTLTRSTFGKLMKEFGEIENISKKRRNCFGLCLYGSAQEAQNAIAKLNKRAKNAPPLQARLASMKSEPAESGTAVASPGEGARPNAPPTKKWPKPRSRESARAAAEQQTSARDFEDRLTTTGENVSRPGDMGAHVALLNTLYSIDPTGKANEKRALLLATAKIAKFHNLISDWTTDRNDDTGDQPRNIFSRLTRLAKEMDVDTPRFCLLPPTVTVPQAPDPAKTVEQLAELRESFYKGWNLTIFDCQPLPIDIATHASTTLRSESVEAQVAHDTVKQGGGARASNGCEFRDAGVKGAFKLEGSNLAQDRRAYLVNFDPKLVSLRALFLACAYQLHLAGESTDWTSAHARHLTTFGDRLKAYRDCDKLVGERVKHLPEEDSWDKVRKWRLEVVHPRLILAAR
jgi:RNA recognition motif-containing protein